MKYKIIFFFLLLVSFTFGQQNINLLTNNASIVKYNPITEEIDEQSKKDISANYLFEISKNFDYFKIHNLDSEPISIEFFKIISHESDSDKIKFYLEKDEKTQINLMTVSLKYNKVITHFRDDQVGYIMSYDIVTP